MKMVWEKPMMDIILSDKDDVITTSSGDTDVEWQTMNF